MKVKTVLGVVAVMVGVVAAGMTILSQTVPAAERASPDEESKAKKDTGTIAVNVVIEEVDLSANTITARATTYVVPPHGKVGGAVFMMGTTDSHKNKATRFVRHSGHARSQHQGREAESGPTCDFANQNDAARFLGCSWYSGV